jgi:phenylalanyl-tRNA synthetase beta chain
VDVEREEDLVEEVARIRGFDQIPAALPRSLTELAREPRELEVTRRLREALAGHGFDEVVNYSFVSAAELTALGETEKPIALINPLSAEQAVMRTTLLAGLLQNVQRNRRQQIDALRLYELGRVYLADPEGGGKDHRPVARERLTLSGVVAGNRHARGWTAKESAVDFFDAKGAVEAVLEALHLGGATFEPLESPHFHPRAAAVVKLNGERVGELGELHPRVAKKLDLGGGLYLFELDADALGAKAELIPSFRPLTRYPAVLRDLAVVVPLELSHREIQQVIREVGGPLVEEVRVFDVYTGKPIPEGKKNVAYALRYRAGDRTLTDLEVSEAHQRIVAEVNTRLGAALRG